MEIGCDWLSASLEWLYSILVWTKGFVFGPDLPWLKGKTSMEENRYLSGEAQDIKDKNGERERERLQDIRRAFLLQIKITTLDGNANFN